MSVSQAATHLREPSSKTVSPNQRKIKFGPVNPFQRELKRRVDKYFTDNNRDRFGGAAMVRKTAAIFLWFGVCYFLLVLAGLPLWVDILLAVSVAFAAAGIGFNVQHDGGHRAYSSSPLMNKLMALSIDVMGGSSYFWNYKHNYFHHTFANITGHDDDIELGIWGRLSPHQKHLFFHRWQHFYLWFLYGFLTVKWHLIDDFKHFIAGRINGHPIPRPKGTELALFAGGKVAFFSVAFIFPLFFHPFWVVALFYLGITFVEGVLLSIVFQLAHCVEDCEFPLPDEATDRMENCWYVHQIETTADFARNSSVLTWYLGGLNYQVEHHLFPATCHLHYPELSKIVEETCREYNVRYFAHPTFVSSLRSHYRWLREMGQIPGTVNEGSPAAS